MTPQQVLAGLFVAAPLAIGASAQCGHRGIGIHGIDAFYSNTRGGEIPGPSDSHHVERVDRAADAMRAGKLGEAEFDAELRDAVQPGGPDSFIAILEASSAHPDAQRARAWVFESAIATADTISRYEAERLIGRLVSLEHDLAVLGLSALLHATPLICSHEQAAGALLELGTPEALAPVIEWAVGWNLAHQRLERTRNLVVAGRVVEPTIAPFRTGIESIADRFRGPDPLEGLVVLARFGGPSGFERGPRLPSWIRAAHGDVLDHHWVRVRVQQLLHDFTNRNGLPRPPMIGPDVDRIPWLWWRMQVEQELGER